MSSISEIRRRLEAACEAIQALDADLAAGRLTAEEHGRARAESEREAGRLFVTLRRAQRQARTREEERPSPPAPAAAARSPWLRHPLTLGLGSALLLAVGIAVGLGGGRWLTRPGRPATTAGAPSPPRGAAPSGLMPEIELQALRLAASREDAPVATLLQFAHVALDQGRLAEVRQAYGRVLAREPRNAEAITHLGAVLFQEGRTDEALAKVEEALRIDPSYIHALWDRVQYLHAKEDYAATVTAADAFLRVVPDGADAESIRRLRDQARQQPARTPPLLPTPR